MPGLTVQLQMQPRTLPHPLLTHQQRSRCASAVAGRSLQPCITEITAQGLSVHTAEGALLRISLHVRSRVCRAGGRARACAHPRAPRREAARRRRCWRAPPSPRPRSPRWQRAARPSRARWRPPCAAPALDNKQPCRVPNCNSSACCAPTDSCTCTVACPIPSTHDDAPDTHQVHHVVCFSCVTMCCTTIAEGSTPIACPTGVHHVLHLPLTPTPRRAARSLVHHVVHQEAEQQRPVPCQSRHHVRHHQGRTTAAYACPIASMAMCCTCTRQQCARLVGLCGFL